MRTGLLGLCLVACANVSAAQPLLSHLSDVLQPASRAASHVSGGPTDASPIENAPKLQINSAEAPQDIISQLKRLKKNFPVSYPQFQTYFLLLPQDQELVPGAINQVKAHPDQDFETAVYGQDDLTGFKIPVRFISALKGKDAFSGVPIGDPDRDQSNLVFIRMSGSGRLVPERVARIEEAAFINGLATRMMLGQWAEKAGIDRKKIDIARPGFDTTSPTPFEHPENWTKPGYEASLAVILHDHPVQGDAMLKGWYAAQLLDGNDEAKSAVWRLLAYRFNYRTLGTAVAYTLSYLRGYSQGVNAITLHDKTPLAGEKRDSIILDELRAQDLKASSDPQIAQVLFDNLLKSTLDHPTSENRQMNSEFLSGFEAGSLLAANDVYFEVFGLAYGLGYADGFTDGYAKGFSEGRAVGYRQGLRDAESKFDWGGALHDFASAASSIVTLIGYW